VRVGSSAKGPARGTRTWLDRGTWDPTSPGLMTEGNHKSDSLTTTGNFTATVSTLVTSMAC
jgi:hypothetical protein